MARIASASPVMAMTRTGLLAHTSAEPQVARAHFARAASMHERCGADAFTAHTWLAWAELLRDHAAVGDDADECVRLARRAHRLSAELGLSGVELRAGRLLAAIGAQPD